MQCMQCINTTLCPDTIESTLLDCADYIYIKLSCVKTLVIDSQEGQEWKIITVKIVQDTYLLTSYIGKKRATVG